MIWTVYYWYIKQHPYICRQMWSVLTSVVFIQYIGMYVKSSRYEYNQKQSQLVWSHNEIFFSAHLFILSNEFRMGQEPRETYTKSYGHRLYRNNMIWLSTSDHAKDQWSHWLQGTCRISNIPKNEIIHLSVWWT